MAAIIRRRSSLVSPSSYARATWLFLRLLGLIYLIAFWSLATQILGLAGHDGILPADRYMTAAHTLDGITRYWMLPTLTWISASDAFLRALCIGGAALAVLLVAGILPALVLPLLWLAYLSLSVVCGEFLSYQWDALLLEAGFLAIFLAPWTIRERARAPADPPRIVVWLFLWLLFRLMVGSGAVKLTSGDAAWRGLTALTVHFETQPIPTPLAWYAHWLPSLGAESLDRDRLRHRDCSSRGSSSRHAACAGGRSCRSWRCRSSSRSRGNYAFFNLLTAALCVFLIDDAAWGAWGRGALEATSRSIRQPAVACGTRSSWLSRSSSCRCRPSPLPVRSAFAFPVRSSSIRSRTWSRRSAASTRTVSSR